MPWVRIDEKFAQHPKVAQAGALAMAMQVAGLCYCNQHLTDGFIPHTIARTLLGFEVVVDEVVWTLARTSGHSGEDIDAGWVIDLLVDTGMWEPGVKEGRPGYFIHDYDDYQPSKAEVEAGLEQRRHAGKLGAEARMKRRAKRTAKRTASGVPSEPLSDSLTEPPSEPPSGTVAARLAEAQAKRKPGSGSGSGSGSEFGFVRTGLGDVSDVGASLPITEADEEQRTPEAQAVLLLLKEGKTEAGALELVREIGAEAVLVKLSQEAS